MWTQLLLDTHLHRCLPPRWICRADIWTAASCRGSYQSQIQELRYWLSGCVCVAMLLAILGLCDGQRWWNGGKSDEQALHRPGMNSCYNPVDLSIWLPPYLPLLAPSFFLHHPLSLIFSIFSPLSTFVLSSPCYPPLCLSFESSLPFSPSISWPPPFFPKPPVSLSLSPAEVQSQGFCLLVIYFPISPLSEVHALGLSVCGGHWGPPKRKTRRVEERRAPWTHW